MLAGKDGGGRDEHRLPPVHHRLEHGAESDLRLAETDVAHEQSVHDLALLHILFDRLDRLQLIGGLFIFEPVLELLLPHRVRGIDVPLLFLAFGIEFQKVDGEFAHGLFDLVLLPCELLAAYLVELRVLLAHELLEVVHLIRSDVKHIPSR